MFGRANPRHARRRPGASERALVLRRLDRIAPAPPVESRAGAPDPALGLDAGGWVPRGRARRPPTGDDPEPDTAPGIGRRDAVEPVAGRPGRTVRLAARFGVSPAHVLLVSVGLVLALVLAGVAFVQARPHETAIGLVAAPTSSPRVGIPVPTPVPADPAVASRSAQGSRSPVPSTPAAAITASLVVHVIGKVRRPGVVRVQPGARVMDAITAAGGAAKGADLSTLNLARPVSDGEQIAVDVPSTAGGSGGLPARPGSGGEAGSGSHAAVVDLNDADLSVLESLPGVGPVLAQRILDFRTENGRFTRIDELKDVEGIGAKTFADIEPHVTV